MKRFAYKRQLSCVQNLKVLQTRIAVSFIFREDGKGTRKTAAQRGLILLENAGSTADGHYQGVNMMSLKQEKRRYNFRWKNTFSNFIQESMKVFMFH